LSHEINQQTLTHVPSALDQQLFFFFNADRGMPWLDKAWAVLSSFDFWLPAFVLAGLLVAWRGGFHARAMLVCLLLSVGIMEGGIINPLKKTIGRQRPLDSLAEARSIGLASVEPKLFALGHPLKIKPGDPLDPPAIGKSLPSGHTSNMFCFATVLTVFYRWRGALFYLPAALVALSRVATGSHWPSDIVVSAIGSILVTLGLLALYAWIWRRWAPRLVPQFAARHPELISTA
jgi:membrane-associated phospholipid phosphatase